MATVQLMTDPARELTDKIFGKWQSAGYLKHQYSLTYLEISNLAKKFLQTCRDQGKDPQEYDLANILDHTLNYYENVAEIENTVGQTAAQSEQEDYSQWMQEAAQEQATVSDLEDKNAELERKNKKIQNMLRQAKAQQAQPQIIIQQAPAPKQPEPPQITVLAAATQSLSYNLQTQINYSQPAALIQQPKTRTQKLCTATAKTIKGTYNVLSLAGWVITH